MKKLQITCFVVYLAALFNIASSAAIGNVTNHTENPDIGYSQRQYMEEREKLFNKDISRALGMSLVLSKDEQKLDKILLQEKKTIIEKSRVGKLEYTPALSFFKSKGWMEETKTFKIIRKMPKGAALHIHSSAVVSLDWLVNNATYRDNVYWCLDEESNVPLLRISDEQPRNDTCDWIPIKDARRAAPSAEEFDLKLHQGLSMLSDDPLVTYPGANKAWERFQLYFKQTTGLFDSDEFTRDYLMQEFQEFYEDNVQYVEIRAGLDRDDFESSLLLFKEAVEAFSANHSDFLGAGLITVSNRAYDLDTITEGVKGYMELRKKYPEFLLGYDLVNREDTLKPLIDYLPALLLPSQEGGPNALPYFFHAGETNWHGTVVDENLLDAILLNTSRIGHGYALGKHPYLVDEVKRRGIGVEICPISNQILGLVSDLRNHAIIPMMSDDFPLVVSSDDPAVWEALPLTHDFFVAYMDMSSEHVGLSFLKQLAINSIRYSAMSESKKENAMRLWQTKWYNFVTAVLLEFS